MVLLKGIKLWIQPRYWAVWPELVIVASHLGELGLGMLLTGLCSSSSTVGSSIQDAACICVLQHHAVEQYSRMLHMHYLNPLQAKVEVFSFKFIS